MSNKKMIGLACALGLVSVALPARADWSTFMPVNRAGYCADGGDFGASTTQHLAVLGGGTGYPDVFFMGCAAEDDAPIYRYLGSADAIYPFGGGAADRISETPSGQLWAVTKDRHIWRSWRFFGERWSRASDLPGGIGATSIAAVDDSNAYVTAGSTAEGCTGGTCVYATHDGGSTWSRLYTDWDAQGGAQVAYDPAAGRLWLVSSDGRVMYLANDPTYGTSWTDVGTNGLGGKPVALAVYGGSAAVIADVNSTEGGPVYYLPAGSSVWTQLGQLGNATDIARDRVNGNLWVVTYNGTDRGSLGGNNIRRWLWSPR